MGKSNRLTDQQCRRIFRLVSDIRDLRGDQLQMEQHLLASAIQLIGATGGFIASVKGWQVNGNLRPIGLAVSQQGAEVVSDALRIMASNNRLWDDPTFALGVYRQRPVEAVVFHEMISDSQLFREFPLIAELKLETRHVDHVAAWYQHEAVHGTVTGISLHRYGKSDKLFTPGAAAAMKLLYQELHWLHRTGRLAPPVPELELLPERLQQVLQRLLAGKAPKAIALELDLSIHTVRDHIRRLYDVFGVRGRDELTAKFLQR